MPMAMADEVSIMEAKPEDISGIAQVLNGTLRQDFVYGGLSFEENVRYSFLRSISHQHEGVYVAKHPVDGVVAFAWFMNHPPANGTAILEVFAVRKDKQRQGIGSKLIQESCRMFVESQKMLGINLRTLHLTTNLDNLNAQRIYARAGYEVAGQVKGFVGKGNVEAVMIKKISSDSCPEEYKTQINPI